MPVTDGFDLAKAIGKDPAIADATVIMLTSAGQPGDAARCQDAGIAAYLPKPLQRSDLRGAIELTMGARPVIPVQPDLITRHLLREARALRRFLVVEDNVVNQLVAKRMLLKGGHSVTVANNGSEALAILDDATCQGFDCVLMDVQMPVMGGFECTSLIRDRERLTGAHLPIIAMTAHSMDGDQARCLAAGMDSYMSKPLRPDTFLDFIENHLSGAVKAGSGRTPESSQQ
jgi:CheY-like chemotaxis protein